MDHFGEVEFWIALGKIVWVDILLSGDNAVVIALAAHSLPLDQRKKAIFGGTAAAILLRVTLTAFAITLLNFPYLKIVGAVLLFYIGVKLLVSEKDHEESIRSHDHLWSAIRTILLADFVMSLDNVIGVAAAAKGDFGLLVFGLLISIPMIVWSSQLILKFMDRFPVIIVAGGALLGFVAGEMLMTDMLVKEWAEAQPHWLHWLVPALGAMLVVAMGKWLAKRKVVTAEVVNLVDEKVSAAPDNKR